MPPPGARLKLLHYRVEALGLVSLHETRSGGGGDWPGRAAPAAARSAAAPRLGVLPLPPQVLPLSSPTPAALQAAFKWNQDVLNIFFKACCSCAAPPCKSKLPSNTPCKALTAFCGMKRSLNWCN